MQVSPFRNSSALAYWTVKVAGVTAVTPPEVAPMLVVPTPVVVAKPAPLGPFAMVATVDEDELQCVVRVMSCGVTLPLNVPFAVNCWVLPLVTVGAAGVIAIAVRVPLKTVRVVVAGGTPETVAVMVTDPAFLP